MKHLFIEPNDVLLFRDGRPFSAGSDHLAVGIFPPPPTALYGAIRSAMLSQNGAEFGKEDFGLSGAAAGEAGTKKQAGTLAIRGFSLACRPADMAAPIARFYPTPADLLVRKEDRNPQTRGCAKSGAELVFLRPRTYPVQIRTNAPLGFGPLWAEHAEGEVYEPLRGYLREDEFARYLEGESPLTTAPACVRPEALFQTEPRTSVRIGPNGTAAESQLFTVRFTRLAPGAGLALSLENADALNAEAGWLRLGGEARSAAYTPCAAPRLDPEPVLQDVKRSGRFRLVLTTPAVFERGWLPDGIGEDGRGELGGCAVRLRGATAGRFQHIGGWDMAAGRPKQTRRAVPAGTVYFFELEQNAGVEHLFSACFGQPMGGSADNRKQGLGITYIGAW